MSYAPAASRLPTRLRVRVAAGVVVAAVVGVAVCALGAVAVHHSVWTQVRAEVLATTEPHVVAHYVEDDAVVFEDGEVVPLWRTEMSGYEASVADGDKVWVVRFAHEERAFLVSEVPAAGSSFLPRAAEWVLLITVDGGRFFGFLLAVAYAAVRLTLGFSPLALPSLLRGRELSTAVLVDYARPRSPNVVLLTATVGGAAYQWEARVASELPPRIGDTLHLAGHPRTGGWIVAWNDDTRLVPVGRVQATDAELVHH
ncbi:hypothetical protein FE697_000330 [Mumia zhuanghuii]|uniref:Uncharacterized protein n=2 Tax=Mumia TaxID=1546255 RepID=A0ABW1QS69_9ACTN|nr:MULTISPECIES: hypothetical protein [Mumia]KAA1424418.1 hypothetical protein FE697_000330 [Mumia zhuanghuii]